MLYFIIGTGSKYGWSGRGWISFSADLPNMVQFMLVLCVLQVINGNCYVVTCFKFDKRIHRLSVSPHILHFCICMFSMKARFQIVTECFHHFFIKRASFVSRPLPDFISPHLRKIGSPWLQDKIWECPWDETSRQLRLQ